MSNQMAQLQEATIKAQCKALRMPMITDRAHILEMGTESYRFRRTAEKQKKGAKTH